MTNRFYGKDTSGGLYEEMLRVLGLNAMALASYPDPRIDIPPGDKTASGGIEKGLLALIRKNVSAVIFEA